MTLNGKHALVTGGGTGIGLAIARALADEGAAVTITGRRQDVLDKVSGGGLTGLTMDVRDEADVIAKTQAAVQARGPVQICVPNAGVAEGRSLPNTDMEFWRNMMSTNLDGAFLTIRECMKSMHQCEWGRVIAISSMAGLKGLKGASCYSASKHGMIGMIRALSEDYITSPITFNTLCPGYVDTDIIPENIARIMARTGMDETAARDVMVGANPHKRLIAPSEIAAAALWLVRPGSESVNGQAIEITGGQM
jgi:3-hydroxybutyrate dehydrogenase